MTVSMGSSLSITITSTAQNTKCVYCGTMGLHRFVQKVTSVIMEFKCCSCGKDFFYNCSDTASYAATKSSSSDTFWIPFGTSVQHAGYTIPGGLIYFGRGLLSVEGVVKNWDWKAEPSLIDPSLCVEKPYIGSHIGAWNYSKLFPASRGSYLKWLTTGRKDLTTNIGYVFIYFYGLERRVLFDVKHSSLARSDFPAIEMEVKRLIDVYGANRRFNKCANKLLDYLQVFQITGPHVYTAAIAPVTVQKADVVQSKGYAIPSPPPKSDKTFSLDMNTIETKLAETVAVSDILNNIFKEDEPSQQAASNQMRHANTIPITGLDSESFTFMQILASKLVWEREELEKLAADHNLMLDGTLDTINDASFDHFGGPFFEGDDSIEINAAFAKEIAA